MTLPKSDALRASRFLIDSDFRERAAMEQCSDAMLKAMWRAHPGIMRCLNAVRP